MAPRDAEGVNPHPDPLPEGEGMSPAWIPFPEGGLGADEVQGSGNAVVGADAHLRVGNLAVLVDHEMAAGVGPYLPFPERLLAPHAVRLGHLVTLIHQQ